MPETPAHQTSRRQLFMATRKRRVLSSPLLFGAIAASFLLWGSSTIAAAFGLFAGLGAAIGFLASEKSIRRSWSVLQLGFPLASDL